MKRFKYLKMTFIMFGLVYLVFPQKAYAYLDPGTGSLILQMIIAGLLGASFAIKVYWKKIKAFFANHFSKRQYDGKDND